MCRYGPVLEEMYTQMEQRQKERQNLMRDAAAQGSVLDKVKQVGGPRAVPALQLPQRPPCIVPGAQDWMSAPPCAKLLLALCLPSQYDACRQQLKFRCALWDKMLRFCWSFFLIRWQNPGCACRQQL
jgi:hypothetical protein